MNRAFISLAALCLIGITYSPAKEPPTLKKRIAVFDFADKSDGTVAWWRGGQDAGQGMSDMLVTALVKSGRYIVIEREKIDQVLAEQSLGASGAISEESAAAIGKLLGVEIAVFGAVTDFSAKQSEQSSRMPMGPMGPRGPMGGGGTITVSTAEAKVTIDVRLVNTMSGQILAAESVAGAETQKGVSLSGGRMTFQNQADFDESMVGKASRKAMDAIVLKIGAQMAQVRWSGKVVKSDDGGVVINAGSATGITVGDTLLVYAKGEELTDPETGLTLGSEETRIGLIVVSADMADGKAAKCTLVQGSGGQRGDIVRYSEDTGKEEPAKSRKNRKEK